jgi:phage baseplate assembly protein W
VAAAQAEAARAITRWEPRLRLSRVQVEGIEDGKVVWRVVGIYNERAVDLKVLS